MIDPFKTNSEQGRLILNRFALARSMIVFVVALSCAALQVKSKSALDINTAYLFAIFAIALIESLIVFVIIRAGYRPTIRFSFFLLCADLVLITAIVIMTGGSKSAFAFLYIAVILATCILLSFKWSLTIATISSALFLLVSVVEVEGYLMPGSAFRWSGPPMAAGDLWAYTGMKVFAFYLTAFLAGSLSKRVGLLQSFQQNILNSISSGFISVDQTGIVTFLNPAGSSLLQRRLAEIAGQHVSSVFAVADAKENPLEEAIIRQQEYRTEVKITRGDGNTIPVGITVSPIRDGAGRLRGAVGSFIDLTELKRMEERLRRADRLAAVGEISASLAHEIRNPVASVRGAIEELSGSRPVEGTDGQLMNIAIRECDQLSRIVSNFLDFVGAPQRENERIDISGLLDETVQSVELGRQNGNVEILKRYPPNLGHIAGDRSQIKEAFVNVIQNSIEATPKGGSIRLDARFEQALPGQVSILVTDEGEGLSLPQMERIFDPFYTTKPRGVGLGLSIVHRIVTSHGGSIDVESAEGNGTTVVISLPIQD